MAWYPHITHEWYSDNEEKLKVDFEKETFNATPTTMSGQPDPFIIEYPNKEKFDPIRGSGANINLLSETNFQLTSFLGNDPIEWRVRFFSDGVLKWFGYLDRSRYEEPYTEIENYYVNLQATDGLGYLDKIQFLDISGSKYTGHMSQWDVLYLIFQKWGLLDQITEVRVGLSTLLAKYPKASSETLFHLTQVNMANYYDEDGRAMTCREVLDAILRPYGAYVQISGTYILIYDINYIAGGGDRGASSTTYFNNSFVYAGSWLPISPVSIHEDLGIYKTGGTLSVQELYKAVDIEYSKYKAEPIETHITDATYYTATQSWVHDTSGNDDYYRQYVDSHSEWYFYDAAGNDPKARIIGTKQEDADTPEYNLVVENIDFGNNPQVDATIDGAASASFYAGPWVTGDSDYFIRIKGKMKANTRTDPFNSSTGDNPTKPSNAFRIGVVIRISSGSLEGKAFHSSSTWVDWDSEFFEDKINYLYGKVDFDESSNDVWLDICTANGDDSLYSPHPNTSDEGALFGLEEGVSGYISLYISEKIQGLTPILYQDEEEFTERPDYSEKIRDVWFQELDINVVQKGTLLENDGDINYTTSVTSSWTNPMETVHLKHGCSGVVEGTPLDQAAMMISSESNYVYITSWSRQDETGSIEELLSRSIMSNYSASCKELSLSLNCPSMSISQVIIDPTYLTESFFTPIAARINPTRLSCDYSLVEVKKDTLDIERGGVI